MQLISNELNAALCEQLVHEKYNANLYLFYAGFFKNKGFNNIGEFFKHQHEEETGHSLIIFDLLTDLNSPVMIEEVNAVNAPTDSIFSIANAYLEREFVTTTSLHEIKKMAIEDENPVVEERMREMIKLQQNEYSEASDFVDKAQLTGGDWKWVMMWDLSLK